MKPVNMIVTHDPANGSWGDCTRACVASIFELPAEEVPHFCEGSEANRIMEDGITRVWYKRLIDWLEARGFSCIQFNLDEDTAEWPEACCQFHYIRGGETRRGTPHDTVWFGGKMVHDPAVYDPVGLLPDAWPQTVLIFVKK